MFSTDNWHSVPEGGASNLGEESVVPPCDITKGTCLDMFAHKQSGWGHGAVGNFDKGNFFFVARRAFSESMESWYFWAFTPRLHLNTLFLFPRSVSLPLEDHPFVAALTQASHSLQSAAASSALSPLTIEWTTRATQGWCFAGQSWRNSSSIIHPYALTHSTRRECRPILSLGGCGEGSEVRVEDKDGIFEGNRWNWNSVRGALTQTEHCSRSKGW